MPHVLPANDNVKLFPHPKALSLTKIFIERFVSISVAFLVVLLPSFVHLELSTVDSRRLTGYHLEDSIHFEISRN